MKNQQLTLSLLVLLFSSTCLGAIKDRCEPIPRWSDSQNYKINDVIQYAGQSYKAKWWNSAEKPLASEEFGPWQLQGQCLYQTDEQTPLPVGEGQDFSIFEQIPEDDRYIDVYQVYPGVYSLFERFVDVEFEAVMAYLIVGTEKAVLFDSGLGLGDFKGIVDSLTDKPVMLVNSHYHYDHVMAANQFDLIFAADDEYSRIGAKGMENEPLIDFLKIAYGSYYKDVGPDYKVEPYHVDVFLQDQSKINLGGVELEVITAPGHSPDTIVLLDEERKLMYTGDAFYQSWLFAHLPESNMEAYTATAKKLRGLQHKVERILPNHSVPMADGMSLTKMGDAFEAIENGKPADDGWPGFKLYFFDTFTIYTKE